MRLKLRQIKLNITKSRRYVIVLPAFLCDIYMTWFAAPDFTARENPPKKRNSLSGGFPYNRYNKIKNNKLR